MARCVLGLLMMKVELSWILRFDPACRVQRRAVKMENENLLMSWIVSLCCCFFYSFKSTRCSHACAVNCNHPTYTYLVSRNIFLLIRIPPWSVDMSNSIRGVNKQRALSIRHSSGVKILKFILVFFSFTIFIPFPLCVCLSPLTDCYPIIYFRSVIDLLIKFIH